MPPTPRFLQETFLNLCIIIGAILLGVGLFCLLFTELSKKEAALIVVLGAAIFFGFRKVKSLQSDYSESDGEDGPKGAP